MHSPVVVKSGEKEGAILSFFPLLISYVTLRRENREFFPFNC